MQSTVPLRTSDSSLLRKLIWLVIFYFFGICNWFLYLGLALRSGAFFEKPTEQDQLRFAISRDRYWNLSKQPIPGFEHAFYKLRNGLKLHYITNRPKAPGYQGDRNGKGNLFILLHGYPDSSMMWRFALNDPAIPMNSARLICLDLPNFGGSDTYEKPDTSVLEAVAEFIIAMREEHEEAADDTNKDFSTIIVAHDWGCVIGFRLAAEAPQLADRFILTNGPHIGLTLANKDRVLGSSSKIFKQFKESPRRNFGCLRKSIKAISPLIIQTIMFGYIFAFHLPKFMVGYLCTGGHLSFFRGALKSAHGRNKDEWNAQDSLASTLGPGVIEVETKTTDGQTYGNSVQARAESPANTAWHQTAYYRNGLAFDRWEKSLEIIADLYNIESESSASASVSPIRRRSSSSGSSTLFTEPYNGALKAPSTILWGEKDLALGRAICLDGIGDYLALGSEVILLSKAGHWTPVEKDSRAVVAKAISMCSDSAQLPASLAQEITQLYGAATTLVKR